MTTIEHLRDIPTLRRLRGRHPAVVVCGAEADSWEGRRAQLAALDAELVVERGPGRCRSASAGRR